MPSFKWWREEEGPVEDFDLMGGGAGGVVPPATNSTVVSRYRQTGA